MIHPATRLAFINDIIGYGVIATEFIPKGTVVWVKDPLDLVLTKEGAEQLLFLYKPMINCYAYEEEDGSVVLCWDHARFVNHSCEATCLSVSADFEIAVRDIHPGDQLTDDYAALYIKEPFSCACGSAKCRGTIHPNDLQKFLPEWRGQVKGALQLASSRFQPMLQLLSNQQRAMVV